MGEIARANINADMFAFLKKGGHKPNIKALENAVNRLCLAVSQKDAGQRRDGNVDKSVAFAGPELDMIHFVILCEAVALVLSGELDKLKTDT